MLRKALAVLLLIAFALYFLARPEGGDVALLDWLRDPGGSRRAHAELVAQEQSLTRLEPVDPVRALAEGAASAPLGVPGPRAPELARALTEAAETADLKTLLEASGYRLRGRLRALDGTPLAGVTVEAQQPRQAPLQAVSDDRGTFAFELHGAGGALAVDAQVWVRLAGELGLAPGLSLGSRGRTLVLAPRLDLEGRVQDEQGAPLADVDVHVVCALAASADLDLVPLLPDRFEARVRSDADGRFRFEGLPDLAGLRARFVATGRASAVRTLTELRSDAPVVLAADPR